MNNKFLKMAFAGLVLSVSGFANATIINVDLTFDGSVLSLDVGSDTPGGSSLIAGDSVFVDLYAAGGDFWWVDFDYGPQLFPLTFATNEAGDRIGNVFSEFFLNGLSVLTISELGVAQSSVHIGPQSWSIVAGISFDNIVMQYDLVSSTTDTTISIRDGIFETFGIPGNPIFNNGNISYNSASVPEPSTLAIFALGMIGLASRRFKKQS
jgi:hypothetical protein